MSDRGQSISQSAKGSALLAALCFCAVLGIALASYMAVCYQTLQASHRSAQSVHSLQLAETGLEESLWALNQGKDGDWTGWSLNNAATPRVATKTLNGFSFGNGVTGAASLVIENYDGTASSTTRTLKVSGITTLADGSSITRKLQAIAKRAPLFVNALASTAAAPNQVDGASQQPTGVYFTSGGAIASFDSSNLAAGSGYSAVLSSGSRVRLTNAVVNGYVAATNGLSEYSYLARVAGPATPSSVMIDPARLSTSPYQPVFDLKIPAATEILPSGNATIGNTTTTFYAEHLRLKDAETLNVIGPVVIRVAGDFKIQNNAKIVVAIGGSLQVLLTGGAGELLIDGEGIENQTGLPKNVAIFSAENSASVSPTISTNFAFSGVLYFPYSKNDFVISSNLDFSGSIVAKNIRVTGSPTIRYDVDLQIHPPLFSGIDTPFAVSSWQEIPP